MHNIVSSGQKIFLIDAMALIYRSHFALNKTHRFTIQGLNTGPILGFTNALVAIMQQQQPTHIIVVFDTPQATFRHKIYPAYKATRESQPEDITKAIPYIKSIITAFNIPIIQKDGYEADDIIGTLAYQAADLGWKVYMMTLDKDFVQLVGDNIYLYRPASIGQGAQIIDEQQVLEKWAVHRVDQVRDILALQGDAVDNIPGIPTIGEKTAKKLIKEFDSVENLIANTHQLKGKLKENIIQYTTQGLLSKQLVTIDTKVPIFFDFASSNYQNADMVQLKNIFERLEFRTLIKRLIVSAKKDEGTQMSFFPSKISNKNYLESTIKSSIKLDNITTRAYQYHLVNTPELYTKLLNQLIVQPFFCIDVETTSLDPYIASLVGIAFAFQPYTAYYIPIPEDDNEAKHIVQYFDPVLNNSKIIKIGQNIKFDLLILKKYNTYITGPFFDTMIAHALLEPDRRHNLQDMSEQYLRYTPIPITALIGEKKSTQINMRDVDIDKVKIYACEDADLTLQLYHHLVEQLQNQSYKYLFYEIEMPLIDVLTTMERDGVAINIATLRELSVIYQEEMHKLASKIYTLADMKFNISSPKQLGTVLFEKLLLHDKPRKTTSGQYATGDAILQKLIYKHPIISEIIAYRALRKLQSTYIDALPALISSHDGRIHTSYQQAVVRTGRLSTTHPNLQNIPIRTQQGRAIRKAFVPRSKIYKILSIDYSQIELRIMAAFSQDSTMIKAFQNGEDIHTATASKLFQVPLASVDATMRQQAKTANFGIIYGISAFGLSERLQIGKKEAANLITTYFTEFPAVRAYINQVIKEAQKKGYVTTIHGRKQWLPDINSRNATIRGFAERNAINMPIQGTAAEMIKIAMIRIHQWMKKASLQSVMVLQVHDELVFDAHEEELSKLQEQVIYIMQHALPLNNVPVEVTVHIGNTWLEAHG